MIQENRDEYKRKIEEQQRVLEKLRDGVVTTTAHALQVSNRAYSELSKQSDAVKACSRATKAGSQIHAKIGIEGTKAVTQINEQIYQLSELIGYFRDLKEEQGEEI